ncbi:hypothetical protein [Thalassospira sp. CH_XMU1448-2]|uniref:hypothetical protein n=1 Tax=Thalassospira sp. CH_XMU1448-2 TaxID=3107773 RepID=UPI00300A3A39
MTMNQVSTGTSLDVWAQSGGAFNGAMTDISGSTDATLASAQPSLARVCAPATETELNAAMVTVGFTCGGWEPEMNAAASSLGVCGGGGGWGWEPELNAAGPSIAVCRGGGGWEPELQSAAYTHSIQCRGGW